MADGTVYAASGERRKQKQTIYDPLADMPCLGLQLQSHPVPGLTFPPDKSASVPVDGRTIIADAVAAAEASTTPREPGNNANLERLRLRRCWLDECRRPGQPRPGKSSPPLKNLSCKFFPSCKKSSKESWFSNSNLTLVKWQRLACTALCTIKRGPGNHIRDKEIP